MKVSILKDPSKAARCAYEVWNKEAGEITKCDLVPAVKWGGANLCTEHAICAIAARPEGEFRDKEGHIVLTATAFLRLVRGNEK